MHFCCIIFALKTFHSHASVTCSKETISIKTERDIEMQLNIKTEPHRPSTREVADSSHGWQKEKEGLLYQIENLKSEYHRIVTALKESQSELTSMSHEKAKLEQKITVKSALFLKEKEELQVSLAQQQTKFDEHKEIAAQTIENMAKEKNILLAKIKQLQTGIAHQQSIENSGKQSPSDVHSDDDMNEYEVDAIIGHKGGKNCRQYRVRWKDFGPAADTWEKASNLTCPAILNEYKKTKNIK